ncbi:helix-turn-helix transcriptional regulator [Arsukibacterium perlucidum]|uniref:helix-turn-helix transcriptional regulator n=1 Tax=Arsukibacterium perlucidum TaxID=368811 RepID=UPI00039EFE89|nr:helix-turn-helix transcriptional regulator [Arsukibacterium perlucidum]
MYQTIHLVLLVVSFALVCSQLFVRQKQLVHLLFAAFSGSMAIMAVKRLGGDGFGFYQYLLAMGICMTCNGYWLVARALFRQGRAILLRHILVAAAIGLLIISLQAMQLLQQFWPASQTLLASARVVCKELLILLSSAILMLTLWEGCRGYSQACGAERWHRQLFLATYGGAIAIFGVIAKIWLPAEGAALQHDLLSAVAALTILVVTQWLIYCRFNKPLCVQSQSTADAVINIQVEPAQHDSLATGLTPADSQLCDKIRQLLFQKQVFLQANLRLSDLARLLEVPEYRISRLLRSQFHASNFNQFINTLRIEHAKTLLSDPDKGHWPVLVVGLESGFASVGPFTRSFKTMVGYTPHEFRQTVHCREQ